MRRQSIIKKISDSLKSLRGVETYLFGSEARGEAHSGSDIDLLMLLPDTLSIPERIEMERKIHNLLFPIELDNNVELSPIILQKKVWNSRKTPFTVNVTNDCIRI